MSLFSFPAQVNERAARLVAGSVAAIAVVALVTKTVWLVPLLALGFLARVGWGPKFSPLARLAMATAKRLWPVLPVSGAPKRFAQGIGAAVTLVASALLFTGVTSPAWALLGMLAVFATLEAAFAFCCGCFLYAQLQRVGVFPPDACVDCSPMVQ